MTKRWGPNCRSDLGKSKRDASKDRRSDSKRIVRSEKATFRDAMAVRMGEMAAEIEVPGPLTIANTT